MTKLTEHEQWMRRCLDLAERGAGHVSPNPLVGAVLVSSSGDVLGEGWHGVYGGLHAEAWAVKDALRRHPTEALRSATMYVSLEPCSHFGKTPPCARLILERGIPRVVVAMEDPNPEVSGRGLRMLREAGVEVAVGVLEKEAWRLNEAFVQHVRTGRPLVVLKVAQTLDGQVATASGDSRWISGMEARTLVHRWRTQFDAVMIGRGTAEADDPALTVRHVEGRQPIRVVLDAAGSLRPDLKLFQDEHAEQTLVIVGQNVNPAYASKLRERGGRVLAAQTTATGHIDLRDLLMRLGQEGGPGGRPLKSVMVEAGRSLATSFFREDLVDRYYLFVAPKLVGQGISSLDDLGVERMAAAIDFAESSWEQVGVDILFRGFRRASGSGEEQP